MLPRSNVYAHPQLYHDVRPESVMILRAAQQVTADPDFDGMLDVTRDRVDEIEGERVVSQNGNWGWTGTEAVLLARLWPVPECSHSESRHDIG